MAARSSSSRHTPGITPPTEMGKSSSGRPFLPPPGTNKQRHCSCDVEDPLNSSHFQHMLNKMVIKESEFPSPALKHQAGSRQPADSSSPHSAKECLTAVSQGQYQTGPNGAKKWALAHPERAQCSEPMAACVASDTIAYCLIKRLKNKTKCSLLQNELNKNT